jgi:hypothetical protein
MAAFLHTPSSIISDLTLNPILSLNQVMIIRMPNGPSNQTTLRGCEACDRKRIAQRQPRQDLDVIHYGTIASGDQVIKHGTTRHKPGARFDALCFKMEAAGIVDDLPCMVIGGICDYADSHKNKKWQGYAVMAAAAFAEELLRLVLGEQVIIKNWMASAEILLSR